MNVAHTRAPSTADEVAGVSIPRTTRSRRPTRRAQRCAARARRSCRARCLRVAARGVRAKGAMPMRCTSPRCTRTWGWPRLLPLARTLRADGADAAHALWCGIGARAACDEERKRSRCIRHRRAARASPLARVLACAVSTDLMATDFDSYTADERTALLAVPARQHFAKPSLPRSRARRRASAAVDVRHVERRRARTRGSGFPGPNFCGRVLGRAGTTRDGAVALHGNRPRARYRDGVRDDPCSARGNRRLRGRFGRVVPRIVDVARAVAAVPADVFGSASGARAARRRRDRGSRYRRARTRRDRRRLRRSARLPRPVNAAVDDQRAAE